MADFRAKARIPFGYRIVDGKAQINDAEARQLKKYFSLYLDGATMAEAARKAGIQCSPTTFRNLLKRKEYCGTDYYPAIISSDYQRELESEWERRKGQTVRQPRERIPKGVRIYTDFRVYTDFRMVKKGTDSVGSVGSIVTVDSIVSNDLVEQMNLLYQRIRPKVKRAATANSI